MIKKDIFIYVMKYILTISVIFFIFIRHSDAQIPGTTQNNTVLLPNGWKLSPAGKSIPLGDLPLNMVISNNKKYAAVTNNGQSIQTIDLIDLKNEKKIDTIIIPKSWYGLAFSSNDKYIYASAGNDNQINKYAIQSGKLSMTDSFILGKPWPVAISPAGIAVDDQKFNQLYVVTKEDSALYVFSLKTKQVIRKIKLGSEAYACLLSPDKSRLYISAWGREAVIIYDIRSGSIKKEIPVGSNPNDLCITKNGHTLFVSNANDNSVSVIDCRKEQVIETLNCALYPNAPSGSTPNGLALNEEQNTLYIANADNNCLAVFDVSNPGKSFAKGFIPVGWYPTAVKVANNRIYVCNGKGLSSMANPLGPNPASRRQVVIDHQGDSTRPRAVQYIGGLFTGTLSIMTVPNKQELAAYSKQVYENVPYSKEKELHAAGESGNPIPMKVGDPSPIKYVFYIIKENRTYDQVLGDMPEGNGDTSLVLFGERITPNQHALAREFVLLDNFYVDAEVSADGHNWSMGAYATDFMEKNWPTRYGQRGGSGRDDLGKRKIANNRDGFIWDHCARHNVSFRTYGEFADANSNPNIPVLEGHTAKFKLGSSIRDTSRIYQWMQDFDSLVAVNAVPQFNTIRLSNDHTEGMRLGRPTPYAHVADNDLAVGMMIEHLSKSPIWSQSAVFILEDDAQNGPDHVDAHRSTAYLISPYVKRHYVDHTMYSTSGMLRTMELILGMPPMTQYDAAATPMWKSFTAFPNLKIFSHVPAKVDLNDVNKRHNELAKRSEAFDWTKVDAVPDLLFNDIIWEGLKGTKAPKPVRAAFVNTNLKEKEADRED
jgi:YVTN family beta-propeller protein